MSKSKSESDSDEVFTGPSASPTDLAARIRETQAKMQAARGNLDPEKRNVYSGVASFHQDVDMARNPGRSHTLRAHFYSGTAAYEVMGKLEWCRQKYAAEDGFIFVSLEKLRRTCYKDHDKKIDFSRREFFEAMALIRKLGGVSPRFERDGREGYVVPPHHALCVESPDGKRCTWVGPTFVNRKAQGLVGYFSLTPEGWIWQPGVVGGADA